MEHDYIVIGCGLCGSVIARKLAEKGKKIKIIERRDHIAGNLYDYRENGILVQKYGPHTFHTNNKEVVDFIERFSKFNEYHLKCEVFMKNKITPSPFNFKTIDQFYDENEAEKLKDELTKAYPQGKATVLELLNSSNNLIKEYAEFLFESDYSLYTSKQWGISPSEIDPSVLRRVPVIFSYKDTYFNDLFEGLPVDGFTSFISNILNHPLIKVQLGINGLDKIKFENDKILYDEEEANIIFTGPIDELFGHKYGKLPYRSLRFEKKVLDIPSFQTAPIVAHPEHDKKYTRITEYTKLPFQNAEKTVIVEEYPLNYEVGKNEPYYPILTEESKEMYEKYKNEASKYKNLFLAGRLADFKYYNMDQVVETALKISDELVNNGL